MLGPDVSGHNKIESFQAAHDAGYGFLFVKTSEGSDYLVKGSVDRIVEARRVGFLVGGYHFGRPDTHADDPLDAVREATWHVSTLPDVDLCSGLDLENKIPQNKDQALAWILLFCSTVWLLTGKWPLLYSFPAWLQEHLATKDPLLQRLPLWISHVGVKEPDTAGLGSFSIWQRSWKGHVPGIMGDVDINETSLTADQLKELGRSPKV